MESTKVAWKRRESGEMRRDLEEPMGYREKNMRLQSSLIVVIAAAFCSSYTTTVVKGSVLTACIQDNYA